MVSVLRNALDLPGGQVIIFNLIIEEQKPIDLDGGTAVSVGELVEPICTRLFGDLPLGG